MLHESWMSILFRLVNFAVIAGLAYYLYKRYFKNRIDDKMTHKEVLLKGLEEQGYFLEGKAHDLDMRIKEQEMTGDLLNQKMQDWNDAVIQEQHKQLEQLRIYAAQAHERVQKKNELLVRQIMQKEVLPQALQEAQKELQQQFANPRESKQFVQDIVVRLQGS